MKNNLRKESNLYKNRKLLYFVCTFTIWYLYIQYKYTGYEKWYIMPITAYATCYFVLGFIIYICTEISMNKYELNNRIYKCLKWQDYHKASCKKKFNKCIIDINKINNWEIPNSNLNITKSNNNISNSSNNSLNYPLISPISNNQVYKNIQPTNLSNYNNVKPVNYYM